MTTLVQSFSEIDVHSIRKCTTILKKEVYAYLKMQGIHIKEIDPDIRQQMLCIKESAFASLMFPVFVQDTKGEVKLLECHVYKNGHIRLLLLVKVIGTKGYPKEAANIRCNSAEMFQDRLSDLIIKELL